MKADPLPAAPIEQIRQHLVALRMPRALEMLDHLVQCIERGQLGTIEAIEALLAEELTIRGRWDRLVMRGKGGAPTPSITWRRA